MEPKTEANFRGSLVKKGLRPRLIKTTTKSSSLDQSWFQQALNFPVLIGLSLDNLTFYWSR